MNNLQYLKSLLERNMNLEGKQHDEIMNDTESFNVHSYNMMPAILQLINNLLLSLCVGRVKSITLTDHGFSVNENVLIDSSGVLWAEIPQFGIPLYMFKLRDTLKQLGLLDLIKK